MVPENRGNKTTKIMNKGVNGEKYFIFIHYYIIIISLHHSHKNNNERLNLEEMPQAWSQSNPKETCLFSHMSLISTLPMDFWGDLI